MAINPADLFNLVGAGPQGYNFAVPLPTQAGDPTAVSPQNQAPVQQGNPVASTPPGQTDNTSPDFSQVGTSPADAFNALGAGTDQLTSQGAFAPPSAASQVNGPFKTHGVVGDILGHVMDAVLVGAGLKPEYAPRVQQAKLADALGTDFATNPLGAAQRLGAAGYLPQATELVNNAYGNQLKAAQTAKAQQEQELSQQTAPFTVEQARQKAATGLYGKAASFTDKNTAAAIGPQLRKQALALGLTPPTEDTPEAWQQWSQEGTTADAQLNNATRLQTAAETARHNVATEGIGQQNANSGAETAAARTSEAGSAGINANTNAGRAADYHAVAQAQAQNLKSLATTRDTKTALKTPPNANPAQYAGHVVTLKNGTKWIGGASWSPAQ